MKNDDLKCKEMKKYWTVLLKLAEKFSFAASQPKALASLSEEHFLVLLMVAEVCYHSLENLWLLQTDKKNLPRTSPDYFNSYQALSSKNEWPLFFTDDLVISGCQRLKALGCRCRRDTFAIQLFKKV